MKVKELLADPVRWTQEELSRDKWAVAYIAWTRKQSAGALQEGS
jgi:hypothetical protein